MSETVKDLQVITVGRFTLRITKETKRNYVGFCSGCGLVTPTKTYGTPLDKWFLFHLNGFKESHGIEPGHDIPAFDTTWRIN